MKVDRFIRENGTKRFIWWIPEGDFNGDGNLEVPEDDDVDTEVQREARKKGMVSRQYFSTW